MLLQVGVMVPHRHCSSTLTLTPTEVLLMPTVPQSIATRALPLSPTRHMFPAARHCTRPNLPTTREKMRKRQGYRVYTPSMTRMAIPRSHQKGQLGSSNKLSYHSNLSAKVASILNNRRTVLLVTNTDCPYQHSMPFEIM